MPAAEPTLATVPPGFMRYFLATRPAFLSVTLVAAFIGLGTSQVYGTAFHLDAALVTVLFALVAHAGINVINDYYDELNGTDRINDERIFPFTGGSRFIQNGVLTSSQTLGLGLLLCAAVIPAGAWLASSAGPGLYLIGFAGLFIGWAYSAPPLKLNSRGLGELAVAAGFALIVIGADFVQRHEWSWTPAIASVSYALLVTNILFINQFPDYKADAAVGKRHWVVIAGPERARWGYVAIVVVSCLWLAVAVASGVLPKLALIALVSIFLSLKAAKGLLQFSSRPARLADAIRATIGAASLHGLALSGALIAQRFI
jgi:1,4-dihydroxy-2-naphthoate octaprenyltransferase